MECHVNSVVPSRERLSLKFDSQAFQWVTSDSMTGIQGEYFILARMHGCVTHCGECSLREKLLELLSLRR